MSTTNPISSSAVAPVELQDPLAAGGSRSLAVIGPRSPLQRVLSWMSSSVVTVIVVLIALIWSVPTFGLFINSFRFANLIHTTGWWTFFSSIFPWQWQWQSFTLGNYQKVIQVNGIGQAFLNSLIIAIPGTVLPVLVAAFAAYAFAWMKFPGRDWLFLGIVALLVVPIQLTLIPNLRLFTTFGITGTYLAIWIAHTAYGLPFAVYLLRSFFGALPADLFESAYIDGASHVRIFFNILLPLSVPALASLVIFQFIWVWNDLLVALIFLGSNQDRAPITLSVANLVNSVGSNTELLTAAAFLSIALPLVLFFSLQRFFVRGILAGSVKG